MTLNDIVAAIQSGMSDPMGTDIFALGGLLNPDNPLAGMFQIAGMTGQGITDAQMMEWANAVQQRQTAGTDVAADPAQMMAKVQGFQQPLNRNLTANVANFVNAQLAARGMATSPGQTDYAMAQAISPFIFQNQQEAEKLAMYGTSLPMQMQPFAYPTFQTSGVASTPGGSGTTPSSVFDPNMPNPWANPSSTGFDPLSWLANL